MNIRAFSESDRDSVIALWQACELTRPWNDPNKDIDRKQQFQAELFFVGEIDSRVMASAMAGYDGHRGSVFYLAVHPDFQGLKYGLQIMQHIEQVLEGLGCPKINIAFRTGNEAVLNFYNKLGYTLDDVSSLGKRLIPDH
ncbi:MAG: GNAT family acetyltransferase [Pseudohongiellaceae bacterium]|nr:GNAT family acetyltransferase [Pseudohongiellaceae bacterium]